MKKLGNQVNSPNKKARTHFLTPLEMKQALYILFSNYGPILELVLLKTQKLRGQAFVVFAYPTSAAAAIQNLQKLLFFGKQMVRIHTSTYYYLNYTCSRLLILT
jgi:hypothetical protein